MKILNFRNQPDESKIKALFDLEVDVKIPELDLVIPWVNRNWKLIRTQNGGLYPSSPSVNLGSKEVPQWAKYDELDEKFRQQVVNKIMKLVEPFLNEKDVEATSDAPF